MLLEEMAVKMPIGLDIDIAALIVLALTYPEALMLLEEMAVKMPIGLDTDVTTLITLALTNPPVMLLAEMIPLKKPFWLVTDVAALIVLALTNPLALKLDNSHLSNKLSHKNEEVIPPLPESCTSIPAYLDAELNCDPNAFNKILLSPISI